MMGKRDPYSFGSFFRFKKKAFLCMEWMEMNEYLLKFKAGTNLKDIFLQSFLQLFLLHKHANQANGKVALYETK